MPIGLGHSRGYRQRPLRELLTLEYGGSLPDEGRHGGDVPVLGSNGIVGSHSKPMVDRPGIVVGRKGSIGKVTWVDRPFWPIDTTYFVDPKTTHSQRWLYYLLDSLGLDRLNSATGVPGLNRDDAYVLKVPVPDEATSEWIAGAIGAVDAAIDATRGVIEQTRRLKTAVLQDLLTRGLPGRHSEFREVKGLGQVPRAWKPTRLKRLTTRITDGVHASVKTVDDGVPFLYVSCVRDGRVLWDHAARITQKTYAEISRGREPVAGGVLYTAVGSYGHAAVLDDDRAFSFQRHIAYLVPDPSKLDPHFLALWLNSERGRRQADRVALGNAQKTITLGELNAWEIPLPKLDEQQDLVAVARSIDGRIAADNAHLLRLGRAKTALSQALLTGRVRVPAKGVPVAS